ncbi:MAG: hypothetical protein IJN50_02780 [Clostridia bacterium]|nr:hypothetical protein [Clostridia bacterium]
MKNKNVLKLALIGALVGIVVFDIVNIVLYLTEGFCVKIENTGSLIAGYLSSSISAAFLIVTYFKFKEMEMSDMSIMKKTVNILVYTGMFLILFNIANILQEGVFKSKEGVIILILTFIAQTVLGGLIQMIVFTSNKGNVKEINKKIKENVLEKK